MVEKRRPGGGDPFEESFLRTKLKAFLKGRGENLILLQQEKSSYLFQRS